MSGAAGRGFLAVARRLLLVLLLASAAAGVLWFRGLDRGGPAPPPAKETAVPAGVEMVTRDFRHVETRMDRTVWVLEATRAVVREEKARLTAVKITWYGESGEDPVIVTSDTGQIDFGRRSAMLAGRVRAQRADGAVLETERLTFDEGRRLLHAPLPVRITTRAFSFRGASLTANMASRRVRLGGRVEGEIRGGAVPGSS